MRERLTELLRAGFNGKVQVWETRPGVCQVVVPLFHEDGDPIEMFVMASPVRGDWLRICDFGITLMRLSYTLELDTPNKERILDEILAENGVREEEGNIVHEVPPEYLYEGILHFAQVVAKVANMRILRREVARKMFFEMLAEFVREDLGAFHPRPKVLPIPNRDDLEVDWELKVAEEAKPIYLFGVRDSHRALLATVACQAFMLENLKFRSVVVHESFDDLPRKDRNCITSVMDKQFIDLDDFRQHGRKYFERDAA